MEQGCFTYVRKYHKCQEHTTLIHSPTSELYTQVPIWPFLVWGLDIIGKISPPSSSGHTFIIIATNYFMKWIEAIPLYSTTAKVICRFILEHIIARFGIPSILFFDNGTPFKKNEVKNFLEIFNVQHHFSIP